MRKISGTTFYCTSGRFQVDPEEIAQKRFLEVAVDVGMVDDPEQLVDRKYRLTHRLDKPILALRITSLTVQVAVATLGEISPIGLLFTACGGQEWALDCRTPLKTKRADNSADTRIAQRPLDNQTNECVSYYIRCILNHFSSFLYLITSCHYFASVLFFFIHTLSRNFG